MQQEHMQAALALILGPETEYRMRVRATRRLMKQGPAVLPLVINTLSTYPEITDPVWPWWPPQYEHLSRLLLHLSQQANLSLEALLTHPLLNSTPGPVLWTGLLETASRIPYNDNEALLYAGLEMPWVQVRYAAAMALAARAKVHPLQSDTLARLRDHQQPGEDFSVRLTASYALLACGKSSGLDQLLQFLLPCVPTEVRKAATFILATECPQSLLSISPAQHEQTTHYLVKLLFDPEPDIAQQAAHILGVLATPTLLPVLYTKLEEATPGVQMIILTVLEEAAQRPRMRYQMRQQALPTRLLPLLKSTYSEVSRQACYTLAACGGEYAAAVLGTQIMHGDQPGQGEALESLRLLRGALRAPLRGNVIRWLLDSLHAHDEDIQVTALDTLTQLLWQAHKNGARKAWQEIREELLKEGSTLQLICSPSPRIRQRALEVLPALGDFLQEAHEVRVTIQNMLVGDSDSGVRACAAYICARSRARWSIPTLLRALLDPDKHVAHTALSALAFIATPEDSIVVYVLSELTHIQHDSDEGLHSLGKEAAILLKKWHKEE